MWRGPILSRRRGSVRRRHQRREGHRASGAVPGQAAVFLQDDEPAVGGRSGREALLGPEGANTLSKVTKLLYKKKKRIKVTTILKQGW